MAHSNTEIAEIEVAQRRLQKWYDSRATLFDSFANADRAYKTMIGLENRLKKYNIEVTVEQEMLMIRLKRFLEEKEDDIRRQHQMFNDNDEPFYRQRQQEEITTDDEPTSRQPRRSREPDIDSDDEHPRRRYRHQPRVRNIKEPLEEYPIGTKTLMFLCKCGWARNRLYKECKRTCKKQFFLGIVKGYCNEKRQFKVVYDDGEVRWESKASIESGLPKHYVDQLTPHYIKKFKLL
jgi:hypothetical protein